MSFYSSNYIGNQFIIAIRDIGGLSYMVNIPRLRAVSRHSALRRAYTTPHRALLLNSMCNVPHLCPVSMQVGNLYTTYTNTVLMRGVHHGRMYV